MNLKKNTMKQTDKNIISLPPPQYKGNISLEETMLRLKSVRQYSDKQLDINTISRLLWAAQGIKPPYSKRTAPSAGSTYPLEVYTVIGNIKGIPRGIYKYDIQKHHLTKMQNGDFRQALAEAALSQQFIAQASFSLIFSAVFERTTARYGRRGVKYVHMEAGHAAQNVCLQAVALGLGTVVIGAFDDVEVSNVLALPQQEQPLYIIPVGKAAD
jgi:SagB-type dehydrogenase family enzyme